MGFESFKTQEIKKENEIVLTKDGAVSVESGTSSKFLIDEIDNVELKTKYGILRSHSGDLMNLKDGKLLSNDEAWKLISEISQLEK